MRVGTRRSLLARVQAEGVVAALRRRHPDLRFVLCPMATSGDLRGAGAGALDFTDAIDRALVREEVDLAVHSAKDLPATLSAGVELVGCPRRADDRDCLVVRSGGGARDLPYGARVGSSSVRRRAQLLRWRNDLHLVELRGNVDTRLARVQEGSIDAAILAVAGLQRLGRTDEISLRLPRREFLPAPAQGALAVVARRGDRSLSRIGASVDHPGTSVAVEAERALVRELGGSCAVPLGAHATLRPRGRLRLTAEVLSPDGRLRLRRTAEGRSAEPARLGEQVAHGLRDLGASALLRAYRA